MKKRNNVESEASVATVTEEASQAPENFVPEKQDPYDEVPYRSVPFPHTHPAHIGAIGALFGLDVQPVESCRVLELGSAAGMNLIPMADHFPDSEFVGVDLSTVQVEEGKALIKEVGLKNIRLLQGDISNLPEDLGQFDYIICHGVYSWIPPEVQDALLSECHKRLNAHGIGYISYNAFPGWHFRGCIRDVMKYASQKGSCPETRLKRAKRFLRFLASSVGEELGWYRMYLNSELEYLNYSEDHYILHEHLEDHNEPLYLHQFAQRLDEKGLRYLGDASIESMFIDRYGERTRDFLEAECETDIERSQWLDMLSSRHFCRSIFCRSDAEHQDAPDSKRVQNLSIRGQVAGTVAIENLFSPEPSRFLFEGTAVTVHSDFPKAAMQTLADEVPRRLAFPELVRRALEVQSKVKGESNILVSAGVNSEELDELSEILTFAWKRGLLRLRAQAGSPFSDQIPDLPQISPLSKHLVSRGEAPVGDENETLDLNDFEAMFLPLLDGKHNHQQLVQEMHQKILSQELKIWLPISGELSDEDLINFIVDACRKTLLRLLHSGLLRHDGSTT